MKIAKLEIEIKLCYTMMILVVLQYLFADGPYGDGPSWRTSWRISYQKLYTRLQRLWDDAFQSLKENKFLRAERALLTILKFDERNGRAYNRLGILYAKQRSFEHAIECFEIAQSLNPNASTL